MLNAPAGRAIKESAHVVDDQMEGREMRVPLLVT
jgi:hypothetical protein